MAIYRGCTKVSGIGRGFNPGNLGCEGQVLTRTQCGYEYCDIPEELPSGGTEGQVLTKTADGEAWCDSQGGGGGNFHFLNYIVVGGGAGGGAYGGGGGGAVCYGGFFGVNTEPYSITIGAGGCRGRAYGSVVNPTAGGDTCLIGLNSVVAKGGCISNGLCKDQAYSGSGCKPGHNLCLNSGCQYVTSSGGGAGGDGVNICTTNFCGAVGGAGLCGYGGGGGGASNYAGYQAQGGDGGGGIGANYCCSDKNGGNATACGGGGGGVWNCGYGGNGGGGLVKLCYKTDGSFGINSATGGTVTTEGDYTVHTFTSDGTFCITG